MPRIQRPFDRAKGAILRVTIEYPFSRAHPNTYGLSRDVEFLIDTGAEDIYLHDSVVSALSLPLSGYCLLKTANGTTGTTIHFADLKIPGENVYLNDIELTCVPDKPNNAYGIFGRKILNTGRLEYDGVQGEYVLILP